MTEDRPTGRDDDLARRLTELQAPEHGPDFWSRVRAAASSTPSPSDTDAPVVEDDDVVVLDDRRRRAPRAWLAAAALVVLALVAVGLLVDRGTDDESDLTTDPTPPTEPDDVEPAPAGPLRPEGDPIERGQGRVIAVDPAGEFLYVADDAPGGGFGCEGSPAQAVFVEPVDGGERRPVLPAEVNDATTGVDIRFGPEGEIAVHTYCEGATIDLVTGTRGDDGTVVDPTELEIPDLDLGRPVDWLVDLEFRSAGTLVASTLSYADDGTEHRHLYEFPVGASEVTDLGPTDVARLDVTADGRLATASTGGTIGFDGEVVATLDDAFGLSISPSGRTAVVAGGSDTGLVVIDITAGTSTPLSGTEMADSGSVAVPDDATVVYGSSESATMLVDSISLGRSDPEPVLLARARPGSPIVLAPDLSSVFLTRWSTSGQEPVIVEQRLTR